MEHMEAPQRRHTDDNMEEFDLSAMEAQTEDMLRMTYLTAETAVFEKTPGGFVSLQTQGKNYPRVAFYRCFPFSDPDRYISVREPDERAREIGIIDDLTRDFDPDTAAVIRHMLHVRYFTPQITRIYSIKAQSGFAYYDVETANGRLRFACRTSGSVVSLSESRILITDLDGNRFEIPDIAKLTPKELKRLDAYL